MYQYGVSPAAVARRRLEERQAMVEAGRRREVMLRKARTARRRARALEANLRPVGEVLAEAERVRQRAIERMGAAVYERGPERLADATHEWMQHTYAASPKPRGERGRFAA